MAVNYEKVGNVIKTMESYEKKMWHDVNEIVSCLLRHEDSDRYMNSLYAVDERMAIFFSGVLRMANISGDDGLIDLAWDLKNRWGEESRLVWEIYRMAIEESAD